MSFVNAPIHDLLIRIKNSYVARKEVVDGVIYSNFKVEVLKLLKKYGFIKEFEIQEDMGKKTIKVLLNTVKDKINDIPVVKFYSRPSRRWYVSYKDIKPVAGGRGIGIISTNKGLLASHEAKAMKLGGELIAEIY